MASGHVSRNKRPNTWLHRPSLRREESSCQPGAVHTWHEPDLQPCLQFGSYRGKTGHGADGPIRSIMTRKRHRMAVPYKSTSAVKGPDVCSSCTF
jgi:hypothetical protein